ncbi:MAG: response regulator [Humidesulfovibrio sp.]|uniref:response regulator n=1 Tax=Humidesulfovibrio sp. TaxID=2910988 RepID=UPI0027E67FC9|nr:response regulator [Humidesulfovibrio sp.]MDQ7834997.1 response regulator [Humidesulfovibrio sp.]
MSKKILIVDDDPAVVDFLEEVLTDNGYLTARAYNGIEGLEQVKAFSPDLITLDMDMPEKGGTMFYIGLRKDEALKGTPIIVISGVGPRPAVLTKDIPTLTKPVEPAVLLDLIAKTLA